MKKLILFAVLLVMICTFSQPAFAYDGNCSAKAAILYQPDTKTVVFEKNSRDKSLVASTTKILTALVVLENAETDEIVEILPQYTGIEGSSMYLKAGERFTVEELLYGMMLVSGNDAATALAGHTSGDTETFAALMNEKAQKIGCVNSHFVNPHGLDAEEHYSCAYDLALIMACAMENEEFANIVSTKTVKLGNRTLTNHNKLLWRCEGITGGKTGYTMSAGRILVTSCRRDEMDFICVTVNAPDDWSDHTELYRWGYENYRLLQTEKDFKIPVISGERQYVTAACEGENLLVEKDKILNIKLMMPKFLYAPVCSGEIIGTAEFTCGDMSKIVSIKLTEDAKLDETIPLSMWEQIKWSWYYYNKYSGSIPFLPRY